MVLSYDVCKVFKPKIHDCNPEHTILNVGTKGFNSEKNSSKIVKSLIDLARSLKTDSSNVAISLIALRYDSLNNKPNEVINRLRNMCNDKNIPYGDYFETVKPENHLNESNLHLNNNFLKYLKGLF